MHDKNMPMKAAIEQAMVAYFGGDTRRIEHARKVTAYAEELVAREGGDYQTVVAAALLHDIGIHQAERKYGSTAGKYQELEGPPIARGILDNLKVEPARIDEICDIVGNHHSPGKIHTIDFKVVYDADWLVNIRDEYVIIDRAKLASIFDNVLLTESGKALARIIYL
ncbi:MAG: HD domain-containing protein, partial [Chloroflexi bacterium]|nr:HD domain-containing protein [Chloroflexota bacterium]